MDSDVSSEKKYLINSKWQCLRFSLGGTEGFFCERIWNNYIIIIITLKYIGKECRLYLLFFCAPENIILLAIRPGSMKFEGKYFYKLIQSKGWKNASWRRTQNKTQLSYSTYQTKFYAKMTIMKWNYTANMIMSVLGIVCHLILYFPVNQGLAINLRWPALKHY